jgi:hypothetical protein
VITLFVNKLNFQTSWYVAWLTFTSYLVMICLLTLHILTAFQNKSCLRRELLSYRITCVLRGTVTAIRRGVDNVYGLQGKVSSFENKRFYYFIFM